MIIKLYFLIIKYLYQIKILFKTGILCFYIIVSFFFKYKNM
jgi:hypothetical protein